MSNQINQTKAPEATTKIPNGINEINGIKPTLVDVMGLSEINDKFIYTMYEMLQRTDNFLDLDEASYREVVTHFTTTDDYGMCWMFGLPSPFDFPTTYNGAGQYSFRNAKGELHRAVGRPAMRQVDYDKDGEIERIETVYSVNGLMHNIGGAPAVIIEDRENRETISEWWVGGVIMFRETEHHWREPDDSLRVVAEDFTVRTETC